MKNLMLLIFLFLSFNAYSNECNESVLVDSYIDYRKALLALNFSKDEVLNALQPEYQSVVKDGYLGVHLVSLRKEEAKILKVNGYSSQCLNNREGVLYADIFHEQGKFELNVVRLKNYGGGFVVESTSLEKGHP